MGADQSRHNLVSGGSEDPNHDAAMRIGAKLRSGGPILLFGMRAMENRRDPPPRTVIGDVHKQTGRAETVGCVQ